MADIYVRLETQNAQIVKLINIANIIMNKIEKRLEELDIKLPQVAIPVANYLPYSRCGNQIYISGQLPASNGKMQYSGKVNSEVTVEDAMSAARLCAINIIAIIKEACGGDLTKVIKCQKLGIFVNADANFIDIPKVANGASDLMVEVFGESGKHSRFAVGVNSLPFGVAVEVDAIFEIC
jgi:enamine deaminase RidA (YjgF/YER057c/UK114 family)